MDWNALPEKKKLINKARSAHCGRGSLTACGDGQAAHDRVLQVLVGEPNVVQLVRLGCLHSLATQLAAVAVGGGRQRLA